MEWKIKWHFCGHTNSLDKCYAIVQSFKSKTSMTKWEFKQRNPKLFVTRAKKKIYEQTIRSCEKHHKLNVLVEQQETYWSNKEISDFLSVIPFCYTGGQSNLKHGVTLQDLLQPIKNGLDLLQAQDPGLRLHQRLLIFLKYNSGGRYESLLHSDCDVSINLIKTNHIYFCQFTIIQYIFCFCLQPAEKKLKSPCPS